MYLHDVGDQLKKKYIKKKNYIQYSAIMMLSLENIEHDQNRCISVGTVRAIQKHVVNDSTV